MERVFAGYRRLDWIIAAVLALLLCVLVGTRLTPGMTNWGDDFAAYMTEGIAISEGRFHEQIMLNGDMYMAEISEEARQNGLVYVWGFPLLLSVVHSLAGFDLVNYSSVILYKLPSLLSFACLVGILYLFYRRFFPTALAAFLTLLLSVSGSLYYSIDILNVDVVFLFASMLSFLLAECFLDAAEDSVTKPASLILSVCLGISFWFTYETRRNGSTVILVIALGHVLRLLLGKKRYSRTLLLRHLVPYAVFFALKVVTEWILAPATSNTSHVGALPVEMILSNTQYYYDLTLEFLRDLSNYSRLYDVLCVCLMIGLVTEAWRWRNLPFTVLMLGTYIVLILLPYTQGLRYLYGILPFLLLYAGYGCWNLVRVVLHFLPAAEKIRRPLALIASLLLLSQLLPIYRPVVRASAAAMREGTSVCEDDVYSEEAIDMYRYIQENTEEEDVVIFIKTRALYLNTGRVSIYPGIHGHTMDDGDYYLYSEDVNCDLDYWLKIEQEAIAPPVYENGVFALYKIEK